MFNGLERETTAVVTEDSEVHLEAPVVNLVFVVVALVTGGSQVGGTQLAARECATSDVEVSPEPR